MMENRKQPYWLKGKRKEEIKQLARKGLLTVAKWNLNKIKPSNLPWLFLTFFFEFLVTVFVCLELLSCRLLSLDLQTLLHDLIKRKQGKTVIFHLIYYLLLHNILSARLTSHWGWRSCMWFGIWVGMELMVGMEVVRKVSNKITWVLRGFGSLD